MSSATHNFKRKRDKAKANSRSRTVVVEYDETARRYVAQAVYNGGALLTVHARYRKFLTGFRKRKAARVKEMESKRAARVKADVDAERQEVSRVGWVVALPIVFTACHRARSVVTDSMRSSSSMRRSFSR